MQVVPWPRGSERLKAKDLNYRTLGHDSWRELCRVCDRGVWGVAHHLYEKMVDALCVPRQIQQTLTLTPTLDLCSGRGTSPVFTTAASTLVGRVVFISNSKLEIGHEKLMLAPVKNQSHATSIAVQFGKGKRLKTARLLLKVVVARPSGSGLLKRNYIYVTPQP